MYVEDDVNDVELLHAALEEAGVAHELVHVMTPWDFSAALRPPPDLILTDGKVAGFGATATLALAREKCPHVPLFCLTGLVTDEKTAAMRDAGARGCLSKHDLAAVTAIIRDALDAPQ